MALKTPYATISQADAYFSDNDTWLDLEDSAKDQHLLNGRYYIDSNYSCTDLVEGEDIPEEYTYANSLLALEDSTSALYAVAENADVSLVRKKVVAGPVSTEKTYSGYSSSSKVAVDKYPQVTSVLTGYCSLSSQAGMKTSFVIRG